MGTMKPGHYSVKDLTKMRNVWIDNAIMIQIIVSCLALHDEFEFDHDKLVAFIEKFSKTYTCLGSNLKITDLCHILKTETGVDFNLEG